MKWEDPKLILLNKTNKSATGLEVDICDAGYAALDECFAGPQAIVGCGTGGQDEAL